MTRVLIHLNHGTNKSYLLTFGPDMPPARLRDIVESGDADKAIQRLMLNSISHIEVPPERLLWSQSQARFTLSQKGFTSEQLV